MHNLKLLVTRGILGELVQIGAARQEEHNIGRIGRKAVMEVLEVVWLHGAEVEDIIIDVLWSCVTILGWRCSICVM